MAELKTKKNKGSVTAFIDALDDEKKRTDAKELLKIFKEETKMAPTMWGTSLIGFGTYHFKSERSSQEGDWPLIAFSPRKQNISLYIMPGFKEYGALLEKIGPHKKSVGCLYIKRLSDVHIPTLRALIKRTVKDMQKKYGK